MADDARLLGPMAVERGQLGVAACLSYVVGCMVGSGIFITPSSVVAHGGSVGISLAVWVAGALVSFCGSFVYIELSTSIPLSGADFAYAVHVGWKGVAFSFMLIFVATSPAYGALLVVTFGDYAVSALSPLLGPFSPSASYWLSRIAGCSVFILLGLVNFFAVNKLTSRVQIVVTSCKMLCLSVVISIGIYSLFLLDGSSHFALPFSGSHWSPGSLVLSAYAANWAYGGWDILNYGLKEVRDPRRTLPLSIILGLSSVCICYLLVNVAFFSVLTIKEMAESSAIILTFVNRSLGTHFTWAISVVIAIFILGTMNAALFAGSRYIEAAANEGHLPLVLGALHPSTGSPRVAISFIVAGASLCSLFDVSTLISSVSFVGWAQKAVSALVLLVIRFKNMPVDEGVIRFPLVFPFLLFLISSSLVVVPLVTEPQVTIFGVCLLALAVTVYVVGVRRKRDWPCLDSFSEKASDCVCRVLGVEMEKKRTDSVQSEANR